SDLDAYYLTRYPGLYAKKRVVVKTAIAEVQRIYQTNYFPEMKVNWQTHLNNIGHLYSLGCFRCHDGQHVSREGKVIKKDCFICHSVVGQEEGGKPVKPAKETGFRHPVEIGDLREVTCSSCHTGGGM
ncbi:MAG: cytochrome c3 family protein, partial [Nitrospirae bacterium]|nr:cytochrome c3 family protein [Nitrospirota bacterium]